MGDLVIGHWRTPLDLPIFLFLVSALIGVWASYDPATSWRKFAMIVAAVALYYLLVALRIAPQMLETFVWLFLFGCCALTLYFVTQHDYSAQPGKFGLITAIGFSLNRITPQLGMHVFDPNVTAGALEIGLPVAVALAAREKEKDKRQNAIPMSPGLLVPVFVSAIITFGLLMTSSRGAWLTLGFVSAIAISVVFAKDVLRRYALPIGLIAVLAVSIVLIRLGDAFVPTLENLLGTIPAGDVAVSRVELLSQAWGLVQDYYFTGSGLGVFPMILSTYALLIDVPFLTHVHNLFLQIWLEQGLLGFVALVWMAFNFYFWAWRTIGSRQKAHGREHEAEGHVHPSSFILHPLLLGGIAAVTVMLLHGMVDVLLYSSRGLPLLLVPFALAVASAKNTEWRVENTESTRQKVEGRGQASVDSRQATANRGGKARVAAYCLVPAALCLLLLSSAFQAMLFGNLGSVEQTRVELGQYHWPDRLVGVVRKNCRMQEAECRLLTAADYFRQAIALDQWNVTANQRLATIALAQGAYDDAQAFLGHAYQRDPSNEVTNRLMRLK